jgi:hypothetical protein
MTDGIGATLRAENVPRGISQEAGQIAAAKRALRTRAKNSESAGFFPPPVRRARKKYRLASNRCRYAATQSESFRRENLLRAADRPRIPCFRNFGGGSESSENGPRIAAAEAFPVNPLQVEIS